MSIARAQIAVDQIRSTITEGNAENIVFVTVLGDKREPDSEPPIVAAVIAIELAHNLSAPIQIPKQSTPRSATIIHAGALVDVDQDQQSELIATARDLLDGELKKRDVGFCQWATDVHERLPESVRHWCKQLGYEQVGTLNYLACKIAEKSRQLQSPLELVSLSPELVDWNRSGELEKLAKLVELTYVETMDCPSLSRHRSALQTLNDYQASSAFDPSLWFRLINQNGEAVGCLILGRHQSTQNASPIESGSGDENVDKNAVKSAESPPVLEIVYMGLILSLIHI